MATLNTFERMRALSFEYQAIMALYLCQRMVPNYELFHQVTGFGDPKPLRSALNACWDWVHQPRAVKVNFTRWQEKVDDVTPSEHGHDMLGVYPAMDACTAVSTLLQGFIDSTSAEFVSVAKISQATVQKFLELTEGEALSVEARQKMLREHELSSYEVEIQQAMLSFLESQYGTQPKPSAALVKLVRSMVEDEGISNVGVEIEAPEAASARGKA